MDATLSHVIYFFGSGLAFFSGLAFLAVGVLLSIRSRGGVRNRLRNLLAALGIVLIVLSAAPLEWWIYGSFAISIIFWMVAEWKMNTRSAGIARSLLLLLIGILFCFEYQFYRSTYIPYPRNVVVIGDSLSAGISKTNDGTWPMLLARQQRVHTLNVRNFSTVGATTESARILAKAIGGEQHMIIVEIGGNDLLGSTTSADFATHLETLLKEVCQQDREVVMFALPLPPFHNQFGLIQRRLAARYSIRLIPQRVLADALTGPDATLDGLHLTPKGHQRLADEIEKMLR